ncbi:glycosyltransferase [Baekduia sp.]|jgi:glycosyltransferase involved in cell wall biosynthesis|uniref:glycosyltransferase n=1 Tax=Baekduia sp. TaxID=2600305 RepID=UPI002DF8ECAF|nr:glycosyltransferase [Baekduia sp.]
MTGDAALLSNDFSRAALVHDWLTIPGGSEKVVLEILDLLGPADVFTSVYDPSEWSELLAGRTVHPSFLDRIPGARRNYPKLLPLMNAAFESFDLADYDLVVSSSHSCAKNVLTTPQTLHVCYCHTPMRHAWEPRFLEGEQLGTVATVAARALMPGLRRRDLAGAARPDVFVANSHHVAGRIAKYYRREAEVIAPPIEIERHLASPRDPGDYYLVMGRVVPYKRVDLALAACAKLGRPVKVVGAGRALDAVAAYAGPDAELLGYVPDEELGPLLAGARAVLFPGEEDFGIVPVEAQAAGVPVIAYGSGGIRDSVVDGVTGVFFDTQTADALADAILAFEQIDFDEAAIRANARRFGPERFRAEFVDLVRRHRDEAGATP